MSKSLVRLLVPFLTAFAVACAAGQFTRAVAFEQQRLIVEQIDILLKPFVLSIGSKEHLHFGDQRVVRINFKGTLSLGNVLAHCAKHLFHLWVKIVLASDQTDR